VYAAFGVRAPQARADVSEELVAHWAFDETTAGSTAADSVGTNDAVPTGSPQPSTDVPPVSFPDARSLSFDGTNYVTYLNPVSTDFTICAWVKTTSTGGGTDHWTSAPILDAETSGVGLDFGFGIGNGGKLMFGNGGRPYNNPVSGSLFDTQVNGATTINDGEWHNVCASRNNTTGKVNLYVDAHLDGSGVTGVGALTRNPNARTAYGYDGAAKFVGKVDDLRVYDVVLTDSQLTGLADGNDNPDALSIESFFPAPTATDVRPSAAISLTFGTTTVATSTGAIGLYKTSDDSLVESFPLDSSRLARSQTTASTTFTVSPANALAESTGYYFSIASTTFEDGAGAFWAGTAASTTWAFTTGDFTAPALSSIVATSTASTTASITWTTSENSSSKVVFGLTSAYGSNTSETDTSPRVTSHAIALSSLVGCTTYHYAVVSRDASLNAATSTDATFTTQDCTASSTPTASNAETITSSSGGTTDLTTESKTFSVQAPAGATATSSSFVIQIQALPSSPVIGSLGKPASAPNLVGATIFNVKAIINGSTILDSFDAPVTISYEYTDAEIAGLDESTLKLYHYHDGAWVALDDCSVDASANSISCTTPSFSDFGLFGKTKQTASSSDASSGGVIPPGYCATNPLPGATFTVSDACKSAQEQYLPQVALANTPTTAPACPAYSFTRFLHYGMQGEDVRALQELMNCLGFTLASSGPGSPGGETIYFSDRTLGAVDAFQSAYAPAVLAPIGASKPTGIFANHSQAKAAELVEER
jgi:hypothetical protein